MLSGVGIGLILAPALSTFLFTVAVAPLTPLFVLLGGRGRALRTLTPFVAGLVVALLAFVAAGQGWLEAPLRTLVAPIAVLLPGALIVTGLTELAAGAMVAGSHGSAFGLVQLLLFVLGVGSALAVVGGPAGLLETSAPTGPGWWAPLLGLALVTVAIALLESVPVRQAPWLAGAILATFTARPSPSRSWTCRGPARSSAPSWPPCCSTLLGVREARRAAPGWWPSSRRFGCSSRARSASSRWPQVEVGPGEAAVALVDVVVVVAAIAAVGVIVGAALAAPLRQLARQLGLPHLQRMVRDRRAPSRRR